MDVDSFGRVAAGGRVLEETAGGCEVARVNLEGFVNPRGAEAGCDRIGSGVEKMVSEAGEVGEGREGARNAAYAAEEAGGEVVGGALEVLVTVLVVLGRRAASDLICGQWAEAGFGHAEGLPDARGGELVEALASEMFGEVTEDEGGTVGVLDGLAGWAVEGFVEDACADAVGVSTRTGS